jgi:predicted ATP-grasp superfamily ATP-dependent carboligase
MAKQIRVLVFPSGSEIAVEIRNSLKFEKSCKIFGATSDKYDSTPDMFNEFDNSVAMITNPEKCIADLNSLIEKWEIDFLFPAHDSVGLFLSENRTKIKCPLLMASEETIRIVRSKEKTLRTLKGSVPTTKILGRADLEEMVSRNQLASVFVKPDVGQGSVGARKMLAKEALANFEKLMEVNDLVLELLPGDEYTIDCLSDRQGKILFSGSRFRRRTKAGISVWTESACDIRLNEMAKNISLKLQMKGAWFFQAKVALDGIPYLLEVGPRISGAMGLYRTLGVNFPLLAILTEMNVPFKVKPIEFKSMILGKVFKNYSRVIPKLEYRRVYLDFDDTLYVNGNINHQLMAYCYYWVSKKIPLVLITRHKGDLNTTLKDLRVFHLFDEIIHITDSAKFKSTYIQINSLFVDDSFREREDAMTIPGCIAIDLSMLDLIPIERGN